MSSPPVAAEETVLGSGEALVRACHEGQSQEAPQQAGLCIGYLTGFIDANPQIVFSEEPLSPYMQRVMRTRAPSHPETQALKGTSYCIDGAESLRAIGAEIGRRDPASAANQTRAGVVQEILDQDYVCQP